MIHGPGEHGFAAVEKSINASRGLCSDETLSGSLLCNTGQQDQIAKGEAAMNGTAIARTKNGKVEYILRGKGPTVLIVHGGHGSCRSDFKQQTLIDHGFSVLIPTRPGYGGTPIASGKTAGATADLFAALLPTLNVKNVRVIGISAGGPTALEFAKRYRGITEKLVLEAAVVKPWFHPLTYKYYGCKIVFHPKRQRRFWDRLNEKLIADETKTLLENLKFFTKLPPKEMLKRMSPDDIQTLKTSLVKGNDSGIGFTFDVEHRARKIENISCPTMIIHSKNDGSVHFSHAEYAHKKIKQSALFIAPTDSHFLYIGPGSQEVLNKRLDFLLS